MNLKTIVLPLVMLVGVAAVAGCNDKVKAEEGSGGDKASVAAPAASDTDTTDENAPSAPPAPEADPQGAAPSPNDVWVGGTYRYVGGHFLWNRGRWEPRREGFVIVPSRWEEHEGKWWHHPARWAHAIAKAAAHDEHEKDKEHEHEHEHH